MKDIASVYKTEGLPGNAKMIQEPDVYRLIVRSRLPSAEKFEAWVFEEVLPAIRKTGKYELNKGPIWLKARLEGKESRKLETDTIAAFVAYATKQGSKNAHNYYTNITRGTYKALFILENGGKWRGLRDHLATLQLNQLSVAEWVAQKYIAEGMQLHMYYKDIYRYAIAKVEEMAAILGKQLPGQGGTVHKLGQ